MINKVIGTQGVYVIEGICGADFDEEVKEFKKQLRKQGKIIEGKVVVKALFFTTDKNS